MADVFCNDGGSNTSPYETWAKAATTFLTAVDAAGVGDRIIIGADHADAPGSTTTYAYPGTVADPTIVISSTVGAGSTVVYDKADNIQVDLSGSNYDMTFTGFVQHYGVSFKIGDDFLCSVSVRLFFDDSVIELSSVNAIINIGSGSGQQIIELRNTDVNFSGGGAAAFIRISDAGIFKWDGGTLSWAGTQPTALFDQFDETVLGDISGVGLSAITSALVDPTNADALFRFRHCKLAVGVSLASASIPTPGGNLLIDGCDDTTGNDLYRLEYIDYWGSTVHDDAIFRSGGASDGTTSISWKMVSTASAAEFTEPTKSPPIIGWVDATGSTTFTINCLWDSVSNIQDDEVWVEFEYLGTAASPIASFADDRMADITATPADQTTNAETWTESLTNDNEFQLNTTVTINRVGPVIARVYLAKPSTTIYVDPKIEVS